MLNTNHMAAAIFMVDVFCHVFFAFDVEVCHSILDGRRIVWIFRSCSSYMANKTTLKTG